MMKEAKDKEEEDARDSNGLILVVDVSVNFGNTYYTNTKVCPHTYVARKVPTKEEKSGHASRHGPAAG